MIRRGSRLTAESFRWLPNGGATEDVPVRRAGGNIAPARAQGRVQARANVASSASTWFRLAARLTATHRVITFDNRGTGRSDVPDAPYSVPTMAQDVHAVLDAAGVDRTHLLGISMGGLIAQEFALGAPARVRSLILAATHVGLPHCTDADAATASILADASHLPAAQRTRALAEVLYSPTTPQLERDRDESARALLPTSEVGYTNQLRGAASWERLADLATLTMPVLVLHGTLDRLVLPRWGERVAAAIHGSTMVLFDDAGHSLFTDSEAPAAETVAEFLSLQGAQR